jgi:hypothetical protein
MILLRLLLALWKPIATLLGFGATYLKGRADARQKATLQAQKTYINKRKAMDNADDSLPSDMGVIRDLLRARDPDKR